jgi:hypothetical protein
MKQTVREVTVLMAGGFFWTRGRKEDREICEKIPKIVTDKALSDEGNVRCLLHGDWLPINECRVKGVFVEMENVYGIFVPKLRDFNYVHTLDTITGAGLDAGRWGGWPRERLRNYFWFNEKVAARLHINPLADWAMGYYALMDGWKGSVKDRKFFIEALEKSYFQNRKDVFSKEDGDDPWGHLLNEEERN